jgi:hypothetical protein
MYDRRGRIPVDCRVYQKFVFITPAEPPQLLAPPVDSDKTERRGSPPWCDDGAAPIALGVAAPRAISTGQIC